MATNVVRFVIVGCGRISRTHAKAIREVRGAELVAAVDGVHERAATLADEFQIDSSDDFQEMLARDSFDAVCVCTPTGEHAEIGILAASAGKHVLTEKPIDVTLESADRLIAECNSAGVCLGVISQYRFENGVQEAKRLIDEQRLGSPIIGNAAAKLYRTQEYYDSEPWRGTWKVDGGGAVMNQGVHDVDLLRWLMGPVTSIDARMTCTAAHTGIEVEDYIAALVEFASGARGVVEATTAMYPGFSERIEVVGTEGTLILDNRELVARDLKNELGETGPYGEYRGVTDWKPLSEPHAEGHEGHRRQIADFVDAIQSKRRPQITGEDGRNALEIILAMYESARTGTTVRLPL